MPEEEYVWLEREDILTFEETARLAGIFMGLGVDRLRLTGGEPLLRRDLPNLIRMLREVEPSDTAGIRAAPFPGAHRDGQPPRPRLHDVALTTNGLLLAS